MTTWERIRVRDEDGTAKTLILRNPHVITFLGEPHLSGIEVNRDGDEVAPRGVDERQHIITLVLVTKRTPLVESRKYGWLVEKEEEER